MRLQVRLNHRMNAAALESSSICRYGDAEVNVDYVKNEFIRDNLDAFNLSYGSRSPENEKFGHLVSRQLFCILGTAKKCTKIIPEYRKHSEIIEPGMERV